MAVSQNGWPVVGKAACDQGPFEGVLLPNGILAGDVATIARWQMRRYEATVEQLVPGWCWGWYVKEIQGSDVFSNHSSATAWDLNAPRHAMGNPASDSMSRRQITACHAIEAASGGVVRWGGDFSRPDAMHWEIATSDRARVREFAEQIRRSGMAGFDEQQKAFLTSNIAPVTKGLENGLTNDPEIREAVQGLVILGIESAVDGGLIGSAVMRLEWLMIYARRDRQAMLAGNPNGYKPFRDLSPDDQTRGRNLLDIRIESGQIPAI